MVGDYQKANKFIYCLKSLEKIIFGTVKTIAMLKLEGSKDSKAISILEKNYRNLKSPSIYQTYDIAQFLKNNEKFNESLKYYSEVIKKISKNHELYPKAKDGRGIAYERVEVGQKPKRFFRIAR